MSEIRKQWEPLVGRLILSCGDIELKLLQLHWNLSLQEGYTEELIHKGLGEKAKYLDRTLARKAIDVRLQKRVSNCLNRVIKLAKKRNLVAHNPLYMDLYSDAEGEFYSVPVIRSMRDLNIHIPLNELEQEILEAKNINTDLWSVICLLADEASS